MHFGLTTLDIVEAKVATYSMECGVDADCHILQASGGAKCEESSNESEFDQVPAFFATHQIMELDVQFQKEDIHWVI